MDRLMLYCPIFKTKPGNGALRNRTKRIATAAAYMNVTRKVWTIAKYSQEHRPLKVKLCF